MRSVDKSAKTREEALEAALQELNASIADVDVQVLEEGSKGLFGLFGSRPYKIRVTLRNQESRDDELDVLSLLNDRKDKAPQPEKPAPKAEKPERPAKAERQACFSAAICCCRQMKKWLPCPCRRQKASWKTPPWPSMA